MSWAVWQWSFNALTTVVVVLNVLTVRRYRRTRYSAGWIDGRLALLQSMAEAQRRGISLADWLAAEAERDAVDHLPELASKLRELGVELRRTELDE